MPDLTLAVAMWWVGTCVACLLLGIGLGSLWVSIRRTGESLRDTVVMERIAAAKTGRTADTAAVVRPNGLAQTNLMMAAVDSPLPGLVGEPLLATAPEPDDLESWIAEESGRDPAFAGALAEAEVAQADARAYIEKANAAAPPGPSGDWADLHDVYCTDDDPGDDPAAPEPGWEDDEDDSGKPAYDDATLTMTVGPLRRYIWGDWDSATQAELVGRPVPDGRWWVPADPRLSKLTRTVVRRLCLRAWLTDPRGAVERLARRPSRALGRVKASTSWGWQPGQATVVVGAPVPAAGQHRARRSPRPTGRHRPEKVAAARASQPSQRPVRVLRHDWRDMLRPPRRSVFSSLPSLECKP